MKKNKIIAFVSILSMVFMLSSFSTSIDGRAVVAEAGELPQGLFAKSIGYLPGDTISVTNMTTRQVVNILVVGSLDASEGVAILLSPEAANAIGVSRNSNIVVKITKRSDSMDKVFSGSAVVSSSDMEDPPLATATAEDDRSLDPVSEAEIAGAEPEIELPVETETVAELPIEETEEKYPEEEIVPSVLPEEETVATAPEKIEPVAETHEEVEPNNENTEEKAFAAVPKKTSSEEFMPVSKDNPSFSGFSGTIVEDLPPTKANDFKNNGVPSEYVIINEEDAKKYYGSKSLSANNNINSSVPEEPVKDYVVEQKPTNIAAEKLEEDNFEDYGTGEVPEIAAAGDMAEENEPELAAEKADEDIFADYYDEPEPELAEAEYMAENEPEIPAQKADEDNFADYEPELEAELAEADKMSEYGEQEIPSEKAEEDNLADYEPEEDDEIPAEKAEKDNFVNYEPEPEIASEASEDEPLSIGKKEEDGNFAEYGEEPNPGVDGTEAASEIAATAEMPKESEPARNETENIPVADDKISKEHGDKIDSPDTIVLVPTGLNPPAEKDKAYDADNLTEPKAPETGTAPSAVAPVAEIAKLDSKSAVSNSTIDKYKVNDLRSLKSGSYYVQIASMSDEKNVMSLISNYEMNYPFAVVPTSSGASLQVMVGPLSVDEYETVMVRFKSYGFKDAFLRKIR